MRNRKTKITTSKNLPHGENSSPAGAPTSGPRATPRQGPRPLEDRRWPWPSNFRLAGTGTGAPGPVSPFSEAAARPRVSGPVAWGLTWLPILGAGGGCGAT